jgi:hypothetical protein
MVRPFDLDWCTKARLTTNCRAKVPVVSKALSASTFKRFCVEPAGARHHHGFGEPRPGIYRGAFAARLTQPGFVM